MAMDKTHQRLWGKKAYIFFLHIVSTNFYQNRNNPIFIAKFEHRNVTVFGFGDFVLVCLFIENSCRGPPSFF